MEQHAESYGRVTEGSLTIIDELARSYEAQRVNLNQISEADTRNLCFATTTRRLVVEVRRLREVVNRTYDLARSGLGVEHVLEALQSEVVSATGHAHGSEAEPSASHVLR